MNESITFLSVAPEVAAAAAVVLLLIVEVIWKPRAVVWGVIAGAGLTAATALCGWQWAAHRGAEAGTFYNGMIAVDGFSALAGMLVFPLAGLGLMSAWRLAASQRPVPSAETHKQRYHEQDQEYHEQYLGNLVADDLIHVRHNVRAGDWCFTQEW